MTDLTQAIANLVRPYMEEMTEATMVARDVLAVVEAHLRPVVTTVAELDTLPRNAVVRDADGWVWVRKSTSTIGWATDDQTDTYYGAKYVCLPATVLYRPAD